MANAKLITAERLHEVLHYDPETGVWTWNQPSQKGKKKAGKRAGCINADGYWQIKVDRSIYPAHKLAFLYMLGKFPSPQSDHRDLNKANCAWQNLREATISQNAANRRPKHGGLKGTSFDPKRKKYFACICKDRKAINLGRYVSEADAHEAYRIAATEFHGEFARFE